MTSIKAISRLLLCLGFYFVSESRATGQAPAGAKDEFPAEVEVNASSGPVELTLRVYKTQIKSGDRIRYQIKLTNIGKKPLRVMDELFKHPALIDDNFNTKTGIYIAMADPKGKLLEMRARATRDSDMWGVSYTEIGDDKKLQALVDGWKRGGLSDHAVRMKIIEYKKKQNSREYVRSLFRTELQPGQTIATPPWGYAEFSGEPERPVGEYADLEMFKYKSLGKYRIRAVYDMRLTEKLAEDDRNELDWMKRHPGSRLKKEWPSKKEKRVPTHGEVMMKTRWVDVVVAP